MSVKIDSASNSIQVVIDTLSLDICSLGYLLIMNYEIEKCNQ